MEAIIVPVNFSACSANAARYAADLAVSLKVEVSLVHIVDLRVAGAETAMTGDLYSKILRSAADGLRELKEELVSRTGGSIRIGSIIKTGSVSAEVSEHYRKAQAELIVLGITRPTLEKFLAGSAVGSLLQLRHPLLVVPEGASFHPYRQIALACDETDISRGLPHSLPLLQVLKERFDARIDVITVDMDDVMSDEACGYALAEERPLAVLKAGRHYIRRRSIVEGLEEYLHVHSSDLVVVFPKQHSLLEFHASRSRAFVRNASVPVLSLPE